MRRRNGKKVLSRNGALLRVEIFSPREANHWDCHAKLPSGSIAKNLVKQIRSAAGGIPDGANS